MTIVVWQLPLARFLTIFGVFVCDDEGLTLQRMEKIRLQAMLEQHENKDWSSSGR